MARAIVVVVSPSTRMVSLSKNLRKKWKKSIRLWSSDARMSALDDLHNLLRNLTGICLAYQLRKNGLEIRERHQSDKILWLGVGHDAPLRQDDDTIAHPLDDLKNVRDVEN